MSPTVFQEKGFRFFFFSKEEDRKHVHVYCGDGEAKCWLELIVELADNYGLKRKQLSEVQRIIEERKDEIIDAWKSTSATEVVGISKHGFWLHVRGQEYFLPSVKPMNPTPLRSLSRPAAVLSLAKNARLARVIGRIVRQPRNSRFN